MKINTTANKQSQSAETPPRRWIRLPTWEVWLTNREAQTEMLQPGLVRQEQLLLCSKTSGHPRRSQQKPSSAFLTPTWSQSYSMDAKHGGQQRQCCRKSRHSSTPVYGASITSDGQRLCQILSCGSERDRNQWPSKFWRGSGDGLVTPLGSQNPAPHAKPWPGTPKEKEREDGLATAGGETLRQSSSSRAPTGVAQQDWPRTECDGEGSSMAYVPLGTTG